MAKNPKKPLAPEPKPGDSLIYAADGHVTGKPSMSSHVEKMRASVSEAVNDDPRFRTGKRSDGSAYPVPVPAGSYDYNKPYVADVLVPDDDGKHHAVVRRDDGKLVKHGFDYDAESGEATMDAGESEETECTPVYTRAMAEYDKSVKASDDSKASSKAKATIKTESAVVSSTEAHAASAKAHESQDPEDHRAAAEAHSTASAKHKTAMIAQAKVGNKAKMDEHMEAIKTHDAAACEHGSKCGDEDDDEGAKAASRVKDGDLITCKFSSAGKVKADDKAWSLDKPTQFMWMPAGVTTVTAGYGEPARPIKLTVECDSDTVKVVKSSLADWKKRFPKRENLVCIEHEEKARAANPKDFLWNDGEDDGGIYCEALPSGEGVRVVNERIYRDFSPSFLTDAQYSKCVCADCGKSYGQCDAKDCGGTLEFPDGVRGSESNPARVTGVGYSVGSLTNKPAFKNIAPVKAREGGPAKTPTLQEECEKILATMARTASPPATNNGANNQRTTMKILITKPTGNFTAGQEIEAKAEDAYKLIDGGFAEDAVKAAEVKQARERLKTIETGKIAAALERAVKRGAIEPKNEAIKAAHLKRFTDGEASADVIVELIDYMPKKGEVLDLFDRQTHPEKNDEHVYAGTPTAQEICTHVIKAREPFSKLMPAQGGSSPDSIQQALEISKETSALLKAYVMPIFAKGGDFALRDVIRATNSDTTDANSQVGTLSSTLILMKNLGYLKNKLNFMQYISTDMRNEPALFGQNVMTRYITPPGVLTYVPGVGYTSDVTAINAYIANRGTNLAGVGPAATALGATQTSGTLTPSVPSTTDVNVQINNNIGCEIVFPTSTLGATVRNLFAEQQGAQLYSLAELVNKVFLATMFSATWSGAATGANAVSLGANFGLPGVIKLKTLFTLNKMPDMGRFLLLHSVYHDQLLTDTNLLTAKAILALINKDEGAFESGELPPLFNLRVLESQLAAYSNNPVRTVAQSMLGLVTPTDPATIAQIAPDGVGFAGNSASACFVARVPQDYTTVFKDIPATASIEIVTEPDSGLSVMFVKYINHQLASVSARAALMFGFAQGDPRQGFVVKP